MQNLPCNNKGTEPPHITRMTNAKRDMPTKSILDARIDFEHSHKYNICHSSNDIATEPRFLAVWFPAGLPSRKLENFLNSLVISCRTLNISSRPDPSGNSFPF